MNETRKWCALLLGVCSLLSTGVFAADPIRIAIGQRGGFGSSFTIPVLAKEDGLFARHELEPEFIYTRGGAETVQAVVTGSVDVGTAGILSVLAAYEKGAPIRIIGADQTGADVFWYADAKGPVQTVDDLAGKRMAYARPGGSVHLLALELTRGVSPPVDLVSCGGIPDCHTMFTTGQLEASWSGPPFMLDQVNAGALRIVARGADVTAMQDQTIRVIVTNARFLSQNPGIVDRYLELHLEAIDRLYADPKTTLPRYAAYAGVSLESAQLTLEFYPKAAMRIAPIGNIALSLRQAVEHGFLSKPLTESQLEELLAARAKVQP